MALDLDSDLTGLTDEELEALGKKKPKPPEGTPPPAGDTSQPIGAPIQPPSASTQPQPPSVGTLPPSQPSTIGQPINPQPAAPRPAGERYQQLAEQGPPQYTGWKRVGDTIMGATKIGSAIEGAGGFGTVGYNEKLANAEQAAKGEEERISKKQAEQDTNAQINQRNAMADYERAHARAVENPPPKVGLTNDEETLHDLMTGNGGQPRINPDTGKPYSYLEAYGALKQTAQDVKPPKESKHARGDVAEVEGIPKGVYGDNDKLYRAGDPAMPQDLKDALADASKAHDQKFKEQKEIATSGRAVYAGARMVNVKFPDGHVEGVDGLDLPRVLHENPGAVQMTGATEAASRGQALINDIRVSAQNVRQNLDVLDRTGFDYAQLAAALAQPNTTLEQYLQSVPRGSLDDQGQQFVSDLFNLREQAMSMRSVLGAGQGSEDLRHAILATLPGISSGSSGFGTKQLDNLLGVLSRVERGIANVPMRPENPNTGPRGGAEQSQPPGPEKPGMKWQHRTVNGKVEWRQVPKQ